MPASLRRKRATSGSMHGIIGSGDDDMAQQQQQQQQRQPSSSSAAEAQEASLFLTPSPKMGNKKSAASSSAPGTAATAALTPPSALSTVSSVPSAAPLTAPTPTPQVQQQAVRALPQDRAQQQQNQQRRALTSNDFFDISPSYGPSGEEEEDDDFFGAGPNRAATTAGEAGASSGRGRTSEAEADGRHQHGRDEQGLLGGEEGIMDDYSDASPVAIHRRSRVLFHEEQDDDDLLENNSNGRTSSRHRSSSANGGGRRNLSLPQIDLDGAAPPPPPQDPSYGMRRSPPSPRRSPSSPRRSPSGSAHRHSSSSPSLQRFGSSGGSVGSGSGHRRRKSRQQQQPQAQAQHQQNRPAYEDYSHHSSAPDVTVGTTRLRGSISSKGSSAERRRSSSQGHRSTLSHPPPYHREKAGGTVDDVTNTTTPLTSSSSGERTSCSSNESSPERYHHHHQYPPSATGMGNRSHSVGSVPPSAPYHHADQQYHDLPSPSKDKQFTRQQQFFWSQRYGGGGSAAPHIGGGSHVSAEHILTPSASMMTNGSGSCIVAGPTSTSSKSSLPGGDLSSPLSTSSSRLWGYAASRVKIRFRTLLSSGLAMVCVLFTLLLLINFRSIPSPHDLTSDLDRAGSRYENEPTVFKPVPLKKAGPAVVATVPMMDVHEGGGVETGGGGGSPVKTVGHSDRQDQRPPTPVGNELHKGSIRIRGGARGIVPAIKASSGAGPAQASAAKNQKKKTKKKRKFPKVDSEFYASSHRHPIKNGGYPRILNINHKVTDEAPKSRKLELYPAEFSDNTQFYPVVDSDDERAELMEMRKPYEDETCEPMHEWQTTYHPSCNGLHELDVEHGYDEKEGEDMQLFGTKGFWRHAWKVDLPGEGRTLETRDTFVLKTLRYLHNFEDNFEEHDRIDAIAMERLTSSPHVINIYGFCGHSVITEYADGPRVGTLADKSKKVPLKRLEIARDIASGLADVHSIDGEDQASFVHLDINPANVVVVGKTLKLNDFNIGIILKKNKETGEQCGFPAQYPNPQWRSPEEANESDNLTEKVDVFSMGHIFFRLICGHEPWNKLEPGGKPTKEEMTEKVKQGKLPFIPEDIMKTKDPEVQAVRDAMLQCYTVAPEKRPSARVIANFLDEKLKLLSQPTEEEDKTKADETTRDAKKEKQNDKTKKDRKDHREKKAAKTGGESAKK